MLIGLLGPLLLAYPLPCLTHTITLHTSNLHTHTHSVHCHQLPAQDKLPQNIVDDINAAIKDVRAAQEAEDLSGRKETPVTTVVAYGSVVQCGAWMC